MPAHNKSSILSFFDILKWGVVIWLMWPLLSFQMEKMTLWRMVFGVMFAVLFLGKMLYDALVDNFKQRKEHYTVIDFLVLVGFIAAIAVLIAGAILGIGLYVTSQFQESGAQ
jgi:hypothetical protein